MKKIFFLVFTFLSLKICAQESYTLSGYLKDASNGEDLIGASVYFKDLNQGTITNVYGFFSITLPKGSYEVEFRYLGFLTTKQSVDLSQNVRLDLQLNPEGIQLEEIVVESEPEDLNVTDIQMSSNKLDIKTIEKLPTLLGEVDVIKSIQLVPGVSTVGEGASGFNVRGGGVGQNLVLLDEAPVYNSSHMLGFFSVFNPDAVKDIKLIKGGIPSRYGGRISSVLDIRMKEGNSKKFQAQGGIGSIFSRVAVEAPIIKDKASFIVAARRSYIDGILKLTSDILEDGAALNFYDINLKANYNINKNNRIFVSSYFGKDVFKFDAQQGFNWGNRTTTVRWNHIYNDRVFSNFTAYFSDYKYELAFGEEEDNQFDWNSRIKTYNFKPEFTYFLNTKNEISFGGELLSYKFEPANAVGVSEGEVRDITIDEKHALESSIYVENKQKFGQNLTVQYGVRFSYFRNTGPGTYHTYDNPEPGTRREVVREFNADNGELIASYSNWEPRLSVNYQLSPSASIKASYNRTSQYIHLISNTTASNPLDVWTPSSNNIEPQIGQQVALGFFKNFGLDNNLETSIEVYYKKTKNQIDYIDGADILINEFLEGDLLSGRGRAYGMEISVKKKAGRFNGWLSYSLARTELQVDGINNGDWYPNRFDQTHNLKLTGFYDLNKRWSFSSTFTFISGTPTTFPNARFTIQGRPIPYIHDGARNNLRVPSYNRLDIAATLQGKKMKKGKPRKNESYWVFSLYNVLGVKNPFSIYFKQEDERKAVGETLSTEARQVSILGSIIPSVSYNFKF